MCRIYWTLISKTQAAGGTGKVAVFIVEKPLKEAVSKERELLKAKHSELLEQLTNLDGRNRMLQTMAWGGALKVF